MCFFPFFSSKNYSRKNKKSAILGLTKEIHFGEEDILFFTKKGDRNDKDWKL